MPTSPEHREHRPRVEAVRLPPRRHPGCHRTVTSEARDVRAELTGNSTSGLRSHWRTQCQEAARMNCSVSARTFRGNSPPDCLLQVDPVGPATAPRGPTRTRQLPPAVTGPRGSHARQQKTRSTRGLGVSLLKREASAGSWWLMPLKLRDPAWEAATTSRKRRSLRSQRSPIPEVPDRRGRPQKVHKDVIQQGPCTRMGDPQLGVTCRTASDPGSLKALCTPGVIPPDDFGDSHSTRRHSPCLL